MAGVSRYVKVVEADGSSMTVRTALALINQVLDEVLLEQEGDFDSDSRFCVKWFTQFGWNDTSSGAGRRPVTGDEHVSGSPGSWRHLPGGGRQGATGPPRRSQRRLGPDYRRCCLRLEVVVRLGHTLQTQGIEESARLMQAAGSRVDLDTVKELAYLLYAVCEKKGWTESRDPLQRSGYLGPTSSASQRADTSQGEQSQMEF